jgi:RimJ/RimL family protein N-acetyltransferase
MVAAILTPPVTGALPPGWQGPFSEARARRWIAERDSEGTTLLAREHDSHDAIGLLILHEEPAGPGSIVEIRLGYLLAEAAWGKGLGGELVSGFVDWCRVQPDVGSVVGGVLPGNVASIRILERVGFRPDHRDDGEPAGEVFYRLQLRGHRHNGPDDRDT